MDSTLSYIIARISKDIRESIREPFLSIQRSKIQHVALKSYSKRLLLVISHDFGGLFNPKFMTDSFTDEL